MPPDRRPESIVLTGTPELSLCKFNHLFFYGSQNNNCLVSKCSGVDPTNLYKRATQRVTFTTLLGSAALAEDHIHLTNDYFLSKGHLVAKADFLYGAQQLTTFWYSNAAPQWQTFNGNNWNALENDCRSFAGSLGADLEVYTGTYVSGNISIDVSIIEMQGT